MTEHQAIDLLMEHKTELLELVNQQKKTAASPVDYRSLYAEAAQTAREDC